MERKKHKKMILRRKSRKKRTSIPQKQTQIEQEEFLNAEAPNGFFPKIIRKV